MEQNTIAAAVEHLLKAIGLNLQDKDLVETPRKVAELWCSEFLAGYQMDPQQILAHPIEGEADPDAIVVTNISFHALCPHHLLPYRGKAHLAYLPQGALIGFGRLAQLVACFTQRLTLQERATHQIAQALMDFLPARGAGCVLEAEHLCLALPGDKHEDSRVLTSAFVGLMKERPGIQQRLITTSGLSR